MSDEARRRRFTVEAARGRGELHMKPPTSVGCRWTAEDLLFACDVIEAKDREIESLRRERDETRAEVARLKAELEREK